MEKSKIFFTASALNIGQKQSHFLKDLEITYKSIFLSAQSDNIKQVKKKKKKKKKNWKTRKYFFTVLGLDIDRKQSDFLNGLEITYQSRFLSARSDNIKLIKKNEKYGKVENMFLRRWLWISVRCSHIFLKVLKLPISPNGA